MISAKLLSLYAPLPSFYISLTQGFSLLIDLFTTVNDVKLSYSESFFITGSHDNRTIVMLLFLVSQWIETKAPYSNDLRYL